MSAVATALAAYATWQGPRSAALLAESMRRKGEQEAQQRQQKLYIFATLMQERAFIATTEAVRVLNLIDVVYNDSAEVREAWADLFMALDPARKIPPHEQATLLRCLLIAMAKNIGLSDGLKVNDFARIYYPDAIAQEAELRRLQMEAGLRSLRGQSSSPPGQGGPPSLGPQFPPKP